MNLTDTHCHLDLRQFDEDRSAVIERAHQAGVRKMLVPAMHRKSARDVLKLVGSSPLLYAAAGVHPTEAGTWDSGTYQALQSLALQDDVGGQKIVAVGEIGLDYYWVKEPEERLHQRVIFAEQLKLARELNKPVVVHMREQDDAWFGAASTDLLEILEAWHRQLVTEDHPLAGRPGVLHSFNGTLETAARGLAINFFIGVTGPVTYKNAVQKRQVIQGLPRERLLIETDSPFLAPVPHRGGRNEPAYVARIADKIAEIHSMDPAEIAEITTANAARLFAWGD